MTSIRRDYKSSVFCMLWEDKEKLLSLYNAMNGTHYTNAEDLVINTLRNAVYMGMKNDTSYIFDMSLNLYEHQSTVNPNMPLRDLLYVAQVLQRMIKDENLYGTSRIMIPTPKFVVFYNGTTKQPERQTLRLSDSFDKKDGTVNLELVVEVVNINPGNNEELLENCKSLREYVIFIEKIRKYVASMSIEAAVERAVDECIEEDVLAEFLSQNKAEAIAMSIYEYNQEAHMKCVRQEGYDEGVMDGIAIGKNQGIAVGKNQGIAEGRIQGIVESILELLAELGEIPEDFRERLQEADIEQLKLWHKMAARADSIEEFLHMIEC